MYQIIVDGIAWVDSDGNTAWTKFEADALAAHIESLGYTDIEVIPV